jgi:4-hydroxybenzoate polyprenyltransferase
MSTIGEYLKVARIHSAVLTGMTPVLGAIVTNYYNPIVLLILYLIGICTHIFGFTLNEYLDVDIDKKSKDLKNKPLVKGTISKQGALTFAFSAIIVGYLLIFILINSFCCPGFFAIIFYTLSWLAIGLYDLTSKKLRGTDIILALWIGLLGLFGGFAVSTSPDGRVFIIGALAFFQLWIQNVLAGLKDVQHDELGSGTTASLRMGVRIENNRLIVPLRFQAYVYFLKFMHAFVILQAFLNFCLSDNALQVYLIIDCTRFYHIP